MSDILDLRYLLRLARATIADPRGGAAEVLRLASGMPAVVYLCFSLVVIGSLILGEVVTLILPATGAGPLSGQPAIALGLIQAAFLFLGAHAIAVIGRLFGGGGSFEGALILITWLQFIFLIVQLLQLVVLLVLPPLAALVMVAAIGLFLWLLVNFIAELHGFTSIGKVFVMTLISFAGILFVVSLVLTLLGLSLETGTP